MDSTSDIEYVSDPVGSLSSVKPSVYIFPMPSNRRCRLLLLPTSRVWQPWPTKMLQLLQLLSTAFRQPCLLGADILLRKFPHLPFHLHLQIPLWLQKVGKHIPPHRHMPLRLPRTEFTSAMRVSLE